MLEKFDQNVKGRVVRLVEARILAEGMSIQVARKIVAPILGVSWHTARQGAQRARREERVTVPLPEDFVAEVAKLRRENQELRDTNELLRDTNELLKAAILDPKR